MGYIRGSRKRKDKGDYSLPGYKYIGPGNRLHKGKPVDSNDRVAEKHDWAYDRYVRAGKDPYWNYNNADDRAQRDFDHTSYGGTLGRSFFTFKRFASQAGYIGNLDGPPHKKLRGSSFDIKDKQVAIRRRAMSLGNLLAEADTPDKEAAIMEGGGDGTGSGKDGNLKETPVDNRPRYLETGPEDYTFARLPYVQMKKIQLSAWVADMALRMTSPYDPEVYGSILSTAGSSTINIPGSTDPDSSGVPRTPANYFNFYGGMYNYYHVVETKWSIFIENTSGEPLYVHWMYYSDVAPPINATNQDMMSWSECNTRILQAQYKAVNPNGVLYTNELGQNGPDFNDNIAEGDPSSLALSNYNAGNNITSRVGTCSTEISGSYRPGQYKREIRLDNQVENWTTVDTNPALQERLLVRLKPENPAWSESAGNARGDIISAKIFIKVDYIVEFKELNTFLRWPVQRQPISVSIASNGTTETN